MAREKSQKTKVILPSALAVAEVVSRKIRFFTKKSAATLARATGHSLSSNAVRAQVQDSSKSVLNLS